MKHEETIRKVQREFEVRQTDLLEIVARSNPKPYEITVPIPMMVDGLLCRVVWDISNHRFTRIMIPLVSRFGANYTERFEL